MIADLEERKKECSPAFVTTLEDSIVTRDGDASFRCKISGYPAPGVKWTFKKKELKPSDRHEMTITDGECVLVIRAVVDDDAGSYVCKLKNKVWHAKNSAILTVGIFPTVVDDLKNVTTNVSGEVEFTCEVAGSPKPKVTWLHAENEIAISEKYEMHENVENFSLKVKDIADEDAGLYTCRITNELGVIESTATVAVAARAKFVDTLQDVSLVSGGEVALTCSFVCEPRPTVTWLLKGVELEESVNHIFSCDSSSCSIRVPLVRPENSGVYTCRLQTSAGIEECSAEVTVVVAPVIETRFSDVECYNSERVEFVCRLSESVGGQVTWFYNGLPMAVSMAGCVDMVRVCTKCMCVAFQVKMYVRFIAVYYGLFCNVG